MWWNHYAWSGDYWPMPFMFFGPVVMFIFIAAGVALLVYFVRGATMDRNRAAGSTGRMSCCEMGLGPHFAAAQDANHANVPRTNGSPAFDEYRAETLRRLEREQGEFQEFVDHLRAAKDKAEFDQFIAARHVPQRSS